MLQPIERDSAAGPVRVGIYLRISQISDRGAQDSIPRQLKECREKATSMYGPEGVGWIEARIWEDSSKSAYLLAAGQETNRPGFKRMRREVRSNVVDVVMFWRVDRLVRRVVELHRVTMEAYDASVLLVSATEDIINTGTAFGMVLMQFLAIAAQIESEAHSARKESMHRARAEAGRPSGNMRSYGFADAMCSAHHPVEAPIVRELVAAIGRGVSVASLATEYRRRGVTRSVEWTVRELRWCYAHLREGADLPPSIVIADPELLEQCIGVYERMADEGASARDIARALNKSSMLPLRRHFSTDFIRSVLFNPLVRGVVEHKGVTHDGAFKGIVSVGEITLAATHIEGRAARSRGTRKRRALIPSSVLRCGACGGPMSLSSTGYICMDKVRRRGIATDLCPGVAVTQKHVEEIVSKQLITSLERTPLLDRLAHRGAPSGDEAIQRAQALTDTLAQLDVHRKDLGIVKLGTSEDRLTGLSIESLEKFIHDMEQRRDRLRSEMAMAASTSVLGSTSASAIRKHWEDRGVEFQRELIIETIAAVRIAPLTWKSNNFTPSRVRIDWIDDPKPGPKILEAIEPDKVGWSRKYDCCQECGTTKCEHASRGLCRTCWQQSKGTECPKCNKVAYVVQKHNACGSCINKDKRRRKREQRYEYDTTDDDDAATAA